MSETIDTTDFFGATDAIDKKMQGGEISTISHWAEESGECTLVRMKLKKANGNPMIEFHLKHPTLGNGSWAVFLPKPANKDFAKAKRMEQLYATLFSAFGTPVGGSSVSEAFAIGESALEKGPVRVRYLMKTVQREQASTGKMFDNQDLILLQKCDDAAPASPASDFVPF